MQKMSKAGLGLAVSALALMVSFSPAKAEDSAQTKSLQAQINALQAQLDQVKVQQQQQAIAAATKPAATDSNGKVISTGGGVKVTVGGFIEAASIERSKNEVTDVASNWNTAIPFNNAVTGHETEFRGSARQSRITLLAEANADPETKIAAYGEADFLGAGTTANSTESNSYNPRMRVGYGTVDLVDSGWHFLAGQQWSLLTTNKVGITPRQENSPLTIDAQYVPGFNWTRNPQLRIVKDLDDHKVNLGVSLESPQASLGGISVPGTINETNSGVSPLNTSGSYSTDIAPDVIAKVAYDPGWGHFEAFGVGRTFHDNVLSTFHNNEYFAPSGGLAAILPVIPKKLDIQANAMFGEAIGRYGSVQLPDFAFEANGKLKMLTGASEMIGVVGHPVPTWDTYLYAGEESVRRANQSSTTYGYGDFGLNNAGCNNQGGSCSAQTSSVWQVTGGFWDRLYEGNYGKVQVGVQDSFTRRNAFSDINGVAPHSYENILMTAFRFYPQ